jgi:K(+)-stimulated pyrophosphate-energized sodium pump
MMFFTNNEHMSQSSMLIIFDLRLPFPNTCYFIVLLFYTLISPSFPHSPSPSPSCCVFALPFSLSLPLSLLLFSDNVGDVAGMGADLFESFVGSLVASCTIGSTTFTDTHAGVAFPLWIAGWGALAGIIGTFMVRANPPTDEVSTTDADGNALDPKIIEAKKSESILHSLLISIRIAIYGASFIVILFSILCVGFVWDIEAGDTKYSNVGWEAFLCILIGLVAGNLIGYFTEYSTSYTEYPTQSIAQKSDTGAATVIIQGLGVGMLSTVLPVIIVVVTVLGAYYTLDGYGVYGVSLTAVGMLSTLGVTLATDAFGPVADNAGGIAEMAPDEEVSADVRNTTDALDALGNTTAATGKGFAIGSAVLTALALLNAVADELGTGGVSLSADLLDPVVLPGVLIGGMLPFVFAALTMLSVGRAAESIMWECRDQLNKKVLEGIALDPQRCVAISTRSSLKEMVVPGILAIFAPVIAGTMLGGAGLIGMLAGAISSGFMLALMMANAGGAWDNAKKYVEKGNLGSDKGKKSDNHKATVVGDTVGDPFKDTSGPALNILIKLMSIISLVIAPSLSAKAWDENFWWIGFVFLLILLVFLVAWYTILGDYIDGLMISHDQEKIEAESAQRKGGAVAAAPAAEEDVKEAEPEAVALQVAAEPVMDEPEETDE